MTVSPSEQHGVPAEEGIEHADARDDLGTDPEAVPNAPNRDPAVTPPPGGPDADDDSDPPSGFESFDEQAEHRGNWTRGTGAGGTAGPNPPH
jgi:hypothetical protein